MCQIGQHPTSIDGLLHVMQELRADENAIILVDHYVQILSTADHFIELGPAAGQATSPTTRESALSDLRWDGGVNLDIQFLPDVTIYCPDCGDTCYQKAASEILRTYKKGEGAYFLPTLMSLRVAEALDACRDLMIVRHRLQILHKLGCAYLTLGEVTTGALGRRSAAPETRQ